jgi:hypothetical protein
MKNQKSILTLVLSINSCCIFAQFPPPAGQAGTTAIYADSSVYLAWGTGCTVTRGLMNIADSSLGYASSGDSSLALGKADDQTISLGDGGQAIVTFDHPIKNGSGWDFAVFENAFDDTFLELGFVEVSSDGINYFRFPATSNTQDTLQTGPFASTDATKLDNLAGKYRVLYGTPFDLQQLVGKSGLNTDSITHVKIIDVVGSILNSYARYDKNGNKVNDPWPTPFPSCGFDLDAVGVINQVTTVTGVENIPTPVSQCNIFPNPVNINSTLQYYIDRSLSVRVEIRDLLGKTVAVVSDIRQDKGWQVIHLDGIRVNAGIYFVALVTANGLITKKIIVNNG